jgi:hypothetical protein
MSSLVKTFTRADGTTQVAYNGHPLYYFVGDKTADATTGQGNNGFGALWWVVTPAGAAITASAGTSTSAAKGGYGY